MTRNSTKKSMPPIWIFKSTAPMIGILPPPKMVIPFTLEAFNTGLNGRCQLLYITEGKIDLVAPPSSRTERRSSPIFASMYQLLFSWSADSNVVRRMLSFRPPFNKVLTLSPPCGDGGVISFLAQTILGSFFEPSCVLG